MLLVALDRQSMKLDTDMTREQCRDTGLAIVLLLLILAVWQDQQAPAFVKAAIAVLVLDMTYPPLFRPAAIVWFAFSHLLGALMSRVLLSVVFFAIVTPMGLLRRAMGKDTLRLNAFKKGRDSVMTARDHTFVAADLEKPF